MANEQNLVSLADRATEEQREIARKGGIASGKTRRRRMALRELTSILLNAKAPLSDEQVAYFTGLGLDVNDVTVQMQMVQAQIGKAVEGDTKAFEVLRDTSGEKPTDKVDMSHAFIGDLDIVLDGEDGD